MFNKFFFRKWCSLWDIGNYCRPQIIMWRMRVACWIPKATIIHSEYVIFIDFQMQQCSPRNRTSMLHFDMIYLLTAIGLSPGGSTHLHTNNKQNNTKQTIHTTTQQFWKSAGRAPSWLVIPWHLPYNRGKSTEKHQSGQPRLRIRRQQ